MANATVTIHDIEFDVTYSATPLRPATSSSPSEGGEVEIESIGFNGIDFSDLLDQDIKDIVHSYVLANAADWAAEEKSTARMAA